MNISRIKTVGFVNTMDCFVRDVDDMLNKNDM